MNDSGVILLVENHEKLCDANRRALELAGFTVYTADTAARARQLAEESQPDLILLDVDLPDGDGFDLCRELWNETTARIILLTSGDWRMDKTRAIASGADACFQKPYRLPDVVESVGSWVRKGRHPPAVEKLLPYPCEACDCWGSTKE